MGTRAPLAVLVAVLALATAQGCRRNRDTESPGRENLVMKLREPDADERKDAAKDLRSDGGPPANAVPALIAAARQERDEDALREMLITLGASGAAEAKPLLDASLQDAERDVRKGAEKGLELWQKKNGAATDKQRDKIYELRSPDWKERREAAEDLADDYGPPREAVGPLLAAASVEQHPEALGAMLVTLGQSGAPEAKPLIEKNLEAPHRALRVAAGKAHKKWLAKNGTAVRGDVESAAPPAAAAAPSNAPDGCDQFGSICAADPFDEGRCKKDMASLAYGQQVAWADCVNTSTLACQKAHDTCVQKARAAPAE